MNKASVYSPNNPPPLRAFTPLDKPSVKEIGYLTGFTLLELLIVVIILGILASLGAVQYSNTIEKGRLAEAITTIGTMRTLAQEYYLKNGTMEGITDSDVGATGCSPDHFFRYFVWRSADVAPDCVFLDAARCTAGGKSPNAGREYLYFMGYYAISGSSEWYCRYTDDNSPCFGLSPGF